MLVIFSYSSWSEWCWSSVDIVLGVNEHLSMHVFILDTYPFMFLFGTLIHSCFYSGHLYAWVLFFTVCINVAVRPVQAKYLSCT